MSDISFEDLPPEIRAVILVFLLAPNKTASQRCMELLKVVKNFQRVSHGTALIVNDDTIYEYACRGLGGPWLSKPGGQTWRDFFENMCLEFQSPANRGVTGRKRGNDDDKKKARHVKKSSDGTYTPRTLEY